MMGGRPLWPWLFALSLSFEAYAICTTRPLSLWKSCMEAPKCCPEGTGCYSQDQWYAQCMPLGTCSTTEIEWECKLLGSSESQLGSSPIAITVVTETPKKAMTTTQTPKKKSRGAWKLNSVSTQIELQGMDFQGAAADLEGMELQGAAVCTEQLKLYASCMNTPTCCPKGSSCYRKNVVYAQCLPTGTCNRRYYDCTLLGQASGGKSSKLYSKAFSRERSESDWSDDHLGFVVFNFALAAGFAVLLYYSFGSIYELACPRSTQSAASLDCDLADSLTERLLDSPAT
eukprot:gb/GEZN01010803.1/.p1 GENE.gb/GEZN01010803.1/~~gb/GEZN01010803.1/.p1  ORF type:complete len:295 (+),score=27.75 gb/GEZN01010803.1/:28-885(+)